MTWQLAVVWVLIAVNAALILVNMRTQRQSKAALERLVALYIRDAERGYDGLRVVAPMSDAELRRRGL